MDLTSGTIIMTDIPQSPPGDWYEIPLSPSYNVVTGNKYAIVIKSPSVMTGDYLRILFDNTSPTYTGGTMLESTSKGWTWHIEDRDFLFEVYGFPP
jgi:hypothetical protein